jgi:beta-xylosidase
MTRLLLLVLISATEAWAGAQAAFAASLQERAAVVKIPDTLRAAAREVSGAVMERVYAEVKTPHKYGVILRPGEGESLDCPNVFRLGDRWYMLYVGIRNEVGYETRLAVSDDLLNWRPVGTVLPFRDTGWDRWQADASLALVDPAWEGSAALQAYDGRYWISYFGGAKQGYEPDPLSLGLAWTRTPTLPSPWTRLAENPVLTPEQPDARPFERATLCG